MVKSRRRWSAKQKVQILKEGQHSRALVSEVCRRHGISTAQYDKWSSQAGARDSGGVRERDEREAVAARGAAKVTTSIECDV